MDNIFVDYRISNEELFNLKKLNINVIKCPRCELVYDGINGHPDILLHILDHKNIMVHRDMDQSFTEYLRLLGYNVVLSSKSLGLKYPQNIILNGLNLPDYFLHSLKYTDENLLKIIENKKIIDVKQGYTKCSAAVINGNAIITSDKSIYTALMERDVDVLLLPPGDILLPGLDYGFIGGCCGAIDDKHMAFFGDLNFYSYGKAVLDFLKKYDLEPVYLRHGKLIDRGSLLKA